MGVISKVYAHAKNLYVRANFSHSASFCAIIDGEKEVGKL